MACLSCLSTGSHVSFQAVSPQAWTVPALYPVSAQRGAGLEPCIPVSTLVPRPESQGCLLRVTVGLRRALPDPKVCHSTRSLYLPALSSRLSPMFMLGTRCPNLRKAASGVTDGPHICQDAAVKCRPCSGRARPREA